MIGIPFCGSAHGDPKNPAGDRMPAPVWEPKAASVRSRFAKEPRFDQTVFDKGRYVNLRGGFQTDLSAGRGRDGHLRRVGLGAF